MNLNQLFTLKDHLIEKANYWKEQGREDKVIEYLKELAEVNEKIQNAPIELM